MTNEVAKHNLFALKLRTKSLSDKEALDKAMKALEQGEVLDKIRTEIADIEEGISSYHNDRPWVFKDEVLRIIDKYKDESEDAE